MLEKQLTIKLYIAYTAIACLIGVVITLLVEMSGYRGEANEFSRMLEQAEVTNIDLEDRVALLNKQLDSYQKQLGDLQQKINKVPYKPKLGLTPLQNKLCLAIATFTEANGEPTEARETIAWAVTNRAVDPRAWDPNNRNSKYQNNICAVVVQKAQYSGMGPYITDINDVVWGKIDSFTPALAKKNPEEMKAWKDILKISEEIIDGKRTRKTLATYFISWRGMVGNRFPEWVEAFMPVSTMTESGLHSLFVDYGYDRETGEVVYFNERVRYNPNKHTL